MLRSAMLREEGLLPYGQIRVKYIFFFKIVITWSVLETGDCKLLGKVVQFIKEAAIKV